MKISLYIDTDNKEEVEELGKIYKALTKQQDSKKLDSYIRKVVSEAINNKLGGVVS